MCLSVDSMFGLLLMSRIDGMWVVLLDVIVVLDVLGDMVFRLFVVDVVIIGFGLIIYVFFVILVGFVFFILVEMLICVC